MMMRAIPAILAVLVLATALVGCRGMRSDRQPIHPNLNMDFGPNFKAQRDNPFFEDGMAMREPVPGTVARERLITSENAPYMQGRDEGGAFVAVMPVAVDEAMLARGLERYQIFCTMCHGGTGDGQGIIMAGNAGQGFGHVPAPTFHSEFLRGAPDGYLYDVITNGIRSMAPYGPQISVADRWAIVAHIRALQRSQAASAADLPQTERERLAPQTPTVTE